MLEKPIIDLIDDFNIEVPVVIEIVETHKEPEVDLEDDFFRELFEAMVKSKERK